MRGGMEHSDAKSGVMCSKRWAKKMIFEATPAACSMVRGKANLHLSRPEKKMLQQLSC